MKCAHTIAAIALSMLSVCHPLAPEEAKVVGTWQWLGMDAIGKLTFTRDHRVAECLLRGEAYEGDCPPRDIKHGRWWIRGDQVVYKIEDGFSDEATLPLQWFLDGGAPVPKGPSFRRIK